MITRDLLISLLNYDPQSGRFVWRVRDRSYFESSRSFKQWNDRYAGKEAGTTKPDSGYRMIAIFKKQVRAHHLAWLWMYGVMPSGEVDHINGKRDDNRIANLRDVPKHENTKNKRLLPSNKTGHHGVTVAKHGKFRAKGYIGNCQKHLGYFDSIEEAIAARVRFEQANGFHQNHGVTA